jgi:hypothetical protein
MQNITIYERWQKLSRALTLFTPHAKKPSTNIIS